MKTNTTHFGYQTINSEEKTAKVADVFHSVAERYDLMNDLMSFGIHRIWKQQALTALNIKPGDHIVDLAGGTGDLTQGIVKKQADLANVTLCDINASMLKIGKDRLIDQGILSGVRTVQANAEKLPFADNSVNRLIIAFGLRNVTNKSKALAEICRVLVPGGRLVVLEFSKPTNPMMQKLYDHYSFKIIPKLGRMVLNDSSSYQYLVESIRMHPDQDTLKQMILEAGFDDCHYRNFTQGVVALHTGYKY